LSATRLTPPPHARASPRSFPPREDLETYPHNGWSLYGLTLALREQGKTDEAAEFQHHFDTSWQLADVQLTSSRL
jgi:hypothetical protein